MPDVISVVQPADASRVANASPTVRLALELDRKFPTKRTRGVIGAGHRTRRRDARHEVRVKTRIDDVVVVMRSEPHACRDRTMS